MLHSVTQQEKQALSCNTVSAHQTLPSYLNLSEAWGETVGAARRGLPATGAKGKRWERVAPVGSAPSCHQGPVTLPWSLHLVPHWPVRPRVQTGPQSRKPRPHHHAQVAQPPAAELQPGTLPRLQHHCQGPRAFPHPSNFPGPPLPDGPAHRPHLQAPPPRSTILPGEGGRHRGGGAIQGGQRASLQGRASCRVGRRRPDPQPSEGENKVQSPTEPLGQRSESQKPLAPPRWVWPSFAASLLWSGRKRDSSQEWGAAGGKNRPACGFWLLKEDIG